MGRGDQAMVASLQAEVTASLSNRGLYYPLHDEEILALLGLEAISLGAFAGDRLIGYAAACFPGVNEDNLGRDLEFGPEELAVTAHLEVGMVHPSFQGQGLQLRLYQDLITAVEKTDRCRYLLSTVAPDNYPALANSLRLGLYIKKLDYKYGGRLRYLLARDFKKPLRIDKLSVCTCETTDLTGQQNLLRQGYCGFDLIRSTPGVLVYYGRPNKY